MTPRVTVLMPVYNGENYLDEAIQSILQQSFTDFEFLIIDDHSTDRSVEIIEEYADRDERIRFFSNEKNIGQAQTLNRGIYQARGELIARMDQDDVSYHDRLEKQVAEFDRDINLTVLGTWGDRIDGYGRTIGHDRERITDFGAFLGNLLVGRCPFLHSSVMFRRGMMYAQLYAPSEDFELWCTMAQHHQLGRVLPETLIAIREHAGQQSTAKAELQREQTGRARKRLEEYWDAHAYLLSKTEQASLNRVIYGWRAYVPEPIKRAGYRVKRFLQAVGVL